MVNSGVSTAMPHDPNAVATLEHVVQSRDPATEVAREQPHGRDDEAGYPKSTMSEKTRAPYQESQAHDLHRRNQPEDRKKQAEMADPEKAGLSLGLPEEPDSKPRTSSSIYAKYRIFFHLGIWLFFTG